MPLSRKIHHMQKELTTLFTGRQREDLEKVDSTNSYLAELLKKGQNPGRFCR